MKKDKELIFPPISTEEQRKYHYDMDSISHPAN